MRRFSFRIPLIAICAFFVPAVSSAANNCPWMNEATASDLLGADGLGAFTAASPGQPAVCTFNSASEGVRRALRITVEVTADASALVALAARDCGAEAAPLKAIGNEAFVCTTDERKGMASVRAMGRVRDQYFTILFATSQRNDPVFTPDMLKSKIYAAAEQVAGNLF